MNDRTCTVDGCDRARYGRGLCGKHYQRWRTTGSVDLQVRPPRPRCSVADCVRESKIRGYCGKHYQRWRKHGDPLYEPTKKGCRVEGCSRPHQARGYCKTHWSRWGRNQSADKINTCVICKTEFQPPKGKPNRQTCSIECLGALRSWGLWMKKPSYTAVHHRVKAMRGPASSYLCTCGKPARDWAYTGPREPGERFPFADDASLYIALCKDCHGKLDHSAQAPWRTGAVT